MVWRNAYQPGEGIVITRLDQTVLSNGKQIRENEGFSLNNMGEMNVMKIFFMSGLFLIAGVVAYMIYRKFIVLED